MVLDYMIHYGYCSSAHVFADTTDQQVDEEVASIRNRQSETCTVWTYELQDCGWEQSILNFT